MSGLQADGYTDPPRDGSMTIDDWLAAGRLTDAASVNVSLPLSTYAAYAIGDDILVAAIADAREKQAADLSVLWWGMVCGAFILALLGVIP